MGGRQKTYARIPWLVYGFLLGVFIVDLVSPLGTPLGVLYVVTVFLTLWSPSACSPLHLALLSTPLLLLGLVFSPAPGPMEVRLTNRLLILSTMWGVALLSVKRQEVEETLTESEARYRLLFERNPHPMWVYDRDTLAFLAVNDAAVHHYGYTREEFLTLTLKDIRPPEDIPVLFDMLMQELSGFQVLDQVRHCTKNGAFIDVEINSHALPFAGRRGRLVLAKDITERKRLEATLQQEREILEVTLASIGDAVITTDAKAAVTFLNPVAERLTGWGAQEALGRSLSAVFRLIDEQTRQPAESPVERVLREGAVVGLANHTVLLTREGREIPIADSGAPIRGKNGQVYGTVLVFRDITEERYAEKALLQAKETAEAADRLKSEFLATMSHELRTPLNVILGYTEMLMEKTVEHLPPAHMEILRRIDHNSRMLFELISMVLDLNRLEAGRLPVDVQAVTASQLMAELQAEMQGLCDQSGLTFTWAAIAELPILHTDPGKLKVVLKNLLSNAVKFTQEGGITVAATESAGGIEFQVTDTGIGIPVTAQAVIFEPFRQVDGSDSRAYNGSGLGLHIVKRLLDMLGGRIAVESEVGSGSTFRVWLPTKKERIP